MDCNTICDAGLLTFEALRALCDGKISDAECEANVLGFVELFATEEALDYFEVCRPAMVEGAALMWDTAVWCAGNGATRTSLALFTLKRVFEIHADPEAEIARQGAGR